MLTVLHSIERTDEPLKRQSIIYVFLVTLPLLYAVDQRIPPSGLFSYNWEAETTGLAYLGLGVGFLSFVFPPSSCRLLLSGYDRRMSSADVASETDQLSPPRSFKIGSMRIYARKTRTRGDPNID